MHLRFAIFKIKWVKENMYTFSIAVHIVNVYKFSGTHFILGSESEPSPYTEELGLT